MSWWVGCDREEFLRRMREEQKRMARKAIDPTATAIVSKPMSRPTPVKRTDEEV